MALTLQQWCVSTHCEKGHLWVSFSSDTAVFPLDIFMHFWISIHIYTYIHVMENKMQTDTLKHQYLCSGMNWTLYYVELIWFWTSRQLGSCVGLTPSNLTLGLLVTYTEEMKSLRSVGVWASLFIAALLTVARKWKPKCPSAYVTIQKMSSTVEEYYLATKNKRNLALWKHGWSQRIWLTEII